jgi:hypothetical protein
VCNLQEKVHNQIMSHGSSISALIYRLKFLVKENLNQLHKLQLQYFQQLFAYIDNCVHVYIKI